MRRMDSELLAIYTLVAIGMTILAAVVLQFAGNYAIYIMLGVCFVISSILSYFSGMLRSWGKAYNWMYFIEALVFFYGIPCLIAWIFNIVVIPYVKQYGFFTLPHIGLCIVLIFLIFRYTTRYEKYLWKTYIVTQEGLEVQLLSAFLLGTEKIVEYGADFWKKPALFDLKSLHFSERHRKLDAAQYKGIPTALYLVYYSEREQQLYKGKFELSRKNIISLVGNGLLFPLTGRQKYNQINLIVQHRGRVTLQLGNLKEDIHFFQGTCHPLDEKELSDYEREALKEHAETRKRHTIIRSTPPHVLTHKEWDVLWEQKLRIKHKITGLKNRILSISAITVTGERYTIKKRFWNGKIIPTIHAPIAVIHYLILNHKKEQLNFEYRYDLQELITHLKNSTIKEMQYTFHLYTTQENLLQATTYEYLDKKQYELKVHTALLKMSE